MSTPFATDAEAAARAQWAGARVAWRDAALDQLVRVLARAGGTQDLSRRLGAYLDNARAIETDHAAQCQDPESLSHLTDWTAERLVELAHKRSDPGLRPFKVALLGLEEHFRAWQERGERPHVLVRGRLRGATLARPIPPAVIAARRNELRRRTWRAVVRLAEKRLAADVKAGRLASPVHRLTPTQRDEVIFTQTGKIRAPKAAAFQVLYLACRYRPKHSRDGGQAAENFRTQLEHVKLVPRAL